MRNIKVALLIILFAGLYSCSNPADQAFQNLLDTMGEAYDLAIINGQLIDGTGVPARQQNLLVRNGEIVFIGTIDTALIDLKKTIDAQGMVVSPGFIDAHAHGNPIGGPNFHNFLSMGVSTICLGQDGFSPPLATIDEWMNKVDSVQAGVNIAMFAGHSRLREESGTQFAAVPEEEQLKKMESLLQKAMDAGCFGLTTGLEYTPGTYAQAEELEALAKVVGQNDGLIMSHIRNEDNDQVEASLRELLLQAEHCRVQASHLKVVYGKGEERADEILSLLFDSVRANSVTADFYPYTASFTGIGIAFPQWAKAPNDYEQVKKERRAELLTFLRNKILQRNGPEATLLGTPPYAGKTLADLSEEQNRPYEEILMGIGPTGASGAYFIMDETLQNKLIQHPKVMLCSDGSPTMRHPRGYGSFAKVIEQFVTQDSLFSLEEAIYKMSGLTATSIGLKDRGTIEIGQKADILVFDPTQIKANATFPKPHQFASGFDFVIVNGQIALENGQISEARFGKVLRK